MVSRRTVFAVLQALLLPNFPRTMNELMKEEIWTKKGAKETSGGSMGSALQVFAPVALLWYFTLLLKKNLCEQYLPSLKNLTSSSVKLIYNLAYCLMQK